MPELCNCHLYTNQVCDWCQGVIHQGGIIMKKMQMIMHVSGDKFHAIKYKVKGEDIYCEIITPKKNGEFGKAKVSCYHADESKVHKT